jgi:hypothetical protein
LVSGKTGDVQAVGLKAETLRQEFVAHLDGAGLPIVAQGPIAEHLEEGEVDGVPDLDNVVCAQALLRVGQARAGGVRFAHQKRDQGMHSGGGKEHTGIVLRDEG